jgi:hypothetical protein
MTSYKRLAFLLSAVLLLSLPMFGTDTLITTSSVNISDNTSYCQSNTCKFSLSGSSVTRLGHGADDYVFGLNSFGSIYQLTDPASGTWTVVDSSNNKTDIAVAAANEVYSLGPTSGSTNVYPYNGSSTSTFGNKVFKAISVSTVDETFAGVDSSGNVWFWNGSSYTQDSAASSVMTRPGSIAIVSATNYWALDSSGNIWYVTYGVGGTQVGGTAAQIAAKDYDSLWVLNSSHNVYAFNGDVTNLSACAPPTQCWNEMYDEAYTIAATPTSILMTNSSGVVYHLNSDAPSTSAEATFQGSAGVPPCGTTGWTYEVNALAVFQANLCPGDVTNTATSSLPADISTRLQTASAPGCDMNFAPSSTACNAGKYTNGTILCYTCPTCAHNTISSSTPDPSSCITNNFIPPNPYSLISGNVGVYIDSTFTGSKYTAICLAFTNWGLADTRTYTCHSSSGPPPNTTAIPYVYVKPNANSGYCVNLCNYGIGYGTSADSRGPIVNIPDKSLRVRVMQIWVDTTVSATNLTGLMAHEAGHFHHLANCEFTCQCGGSLMGKQPSAGEAGNGCSAGAQPDSPTTCDKFWWPIYSTGYDM